MVVGRYDGGANVCVNCPDGEVQRLPHQTACEACTKHGKYVKRCDDALQKVFAKTLGDRDYGIFEAVHVGLRVPLVFSLAACVSRNTSGARVLRSRKQVREGEGDAPVAWDSKLDKFDKRMGLVLKQ